MLDIPISILAKYPFLKQGSVYMSNFDLDEMLTADGMKKIRNAAVTRLEEAAAGMEHRPGDNPDLEILSFFLAAILLNAANAKYLTGRFAEWEGKSVKNSLKREDDRMLAKIYREVTGIVPKKSGKNFLIYVHDFLTRSQIFHDKSWKLVNQDVLGGYVILNKKDTTRLIQKEISLQIKNRIMSAPKPKIDAINELKSHVETMEQNIRPQSRQVGGLTHIPPCVRDAERVMKNGENLSHRGRMLVGTFYLKKEKPVQEIVELFANVPDFDRDVTEYQLEHLRKYSCQSCMNLESLGLCRRTPACGNIRNPLQFFEK